MFLHNFRCTFIHQCLCIKLHHFLCSFIHHFVHHFIHHFVHAFLCIFTRGSDPAPRPFRGAASWGVIDVLLYIISYIISGTTLYIIIYVCFDVSLYISIDVYFNVTLYISFDVYFYASLRADPLPAFRPLDAYHDAMFLTYYCASLLPQPCAQSVMCVLMRLYTSFYT